jgi:hypothetical protein
LKIGHVDAAQPLRTRSPKGTVRKNSGGYLYVHAAGHPNAHKDGQIAVHRLVMAELLGRPLKDSESVHHRNGVRTDNRPENLELRVRYHGSGQAVEDRIEDALWVLREYLPSALSAAA